jgi:hypothetical protein
LGKGAAVAAITVAALAFVGSALGWSRQAALERHATALTGLRPSIVCETGFEHRQGVKAGGTEYLGFTSGTRLIVLAPGICRSLASRDVSSTGFAFATWVLAHELGHVVNKTTDETVAECYALQHWRQLAAALGLREPSAAQVARVAAAHDRLPIAYRGAC